MERTACRQDRQNCQETVQGKKTQFLCVVYHVMVDTLQKFNLSEDVATQCLIRRLRTARTKLKKALSAELSDASPVPPLPHVSVPAAAASAASDGEDLPDAVPPNADMPDAVP